MNGSLSLPLPLLLLPLSLLLLPPFISRRPVPQVIVRSQQDTWNGRGGWVGQGEHYTTMTTGSPIMGKLIFNLVEQVTLIHAL